MEQNNLNSNESVNLYIQLSTAAIEQNVYNTVSALKCKIYKDGNEWCCMVGEDIQIGIAGFGKTPFKAMESFYDALHIPSPTQP